MILDKIKNFAFDYLKSNDSENDILRHIHILDMHKDGYIKPREYFQHFWFHIVIVF